MNDWMIAAMPYAFWGIIIHMVVDWFLQNEWMALNKSNLKHFAGYVHAGFHFLGMLLIFPWQYALAIAVIHLVIDTRVPLVWWRKLYRQTTIGEMAIHVAIWEDQVAHWLIICIISIVFARRF